MTDSSRTLSEDAGGGEHGGGAFAKDSTGGGLFLVLCLAIGLLTRNILAPNMPFPYTVILLLIGLGLGALSNVTDGSQFQDAVNTWANIDPHTILVVFLPTLIFESAFSVDFHVFRRSFWQLFILAVPGMAIGTGLTAAVGVYLFPYQWSWEASLMFGSILAATDPVAVVALLKELGASKQLETLIEGESLLNDGTAIVAFTAFRGMVLGEEKTIEELVGFGLQLSLGGPLLGAIFAAISIVALSYLYNDAVSEITVTVVGCYSVFMIAEATMLHTSGVLAVVTLGVLMSGFGKVHVSPEVEHAMHGFWEMLSYFSNTVIFLLSGVIIAHKTLYSEHIDLQDWGYLLALYALLHVIRLVVVLVCWPALACCGYPVNWRRAAVLTYAGLRGAVGLSLGLIVEQTSLFDAALAKAHPDGRYDKAFRAHVLFFVAGIAFLTLLVNGSTTKALLGALGLQGEPKASKQLFRQSCHVLNNRVEQRAAELQRDPHLLRADWRQLWAYLPVPTADVYRQRRSKGHVFTTRGEQTRLPPRLRNRWMRYAERFDESFGLEADAGAEGEGLQQGAPATVKHSPGSLDGIATDNPAAAAAASGATATGTIDGESAGADSPAAAAEGSAANGSAGDFPPPDSPSADADAGDSALLRTGSTGRAVREGGSAGAQGAGASLRDAAAASAAGSATDEDLPAGRRYGAELCGVSIPFCCTSILPCVLVDRAERSRRRREAEEAELVDDDMSPAVSRSTSRAPGLRGDESGADKGDGVTEGSVRNPLAGAALPAGSSTGGVEMVAMIKSADGTTPASSPAGSAGGADAGGGAGTIVLPPITSSTTSLHGDSAAVVASRRKFVTSLRGCYWRRFERGLVGARSLRLLLDAADWQSDRDGTGALGAFEGALSGSIAVSRSLRLCHRAAALGSVVRPLLFAQLQLLVECASNFAAGHTAAAGKARFWGVGGEDGSAAIVVSEAQAEAGRAEELLQSIEEAFPEVVRATQTGLAVRALLIAERREIESLARDGALEPPQAERLLDANSASTKKATLHPPSLDLPSVRQLIRGMAFASNVDGVVIDKLKNASRRRLVPAGSPIFGVAQPATAVVLLVSGQVDLLAPNAAVVADRGFHVGFTSNGDDGYDSSADPRETAVRGGELGHLDDVDDETADTEGGESPGPTP